MEIQKSLISQKNAGSYWRISIPPVRYKFLLLFFRQESVIAMLNGFPKIDKQDEETDLPESVPLSDM